jgi:ABC transporter with metal-binding/Fe-S-binding domain ATP-binding protein
MRVLALLSGGKDSVCAVETARGSGWDVVAALALHPAEDDAWMFHTPNLSVVRGVAQCLGLPLLETPVRAGAEAELEDLEAALRTARDRFALDGILSGAIASEYQRTRLDAIGHRLGLKTFAPLWHKEPALYVGSLTGPGWDVRFSRVAADGFDASWAGARLDKAAVQRIQAMRSRPHLAGEGGEFETLVLDAPCYSSRLVVDAAAVRREGGRATWDVTAWHVEPKLPTASAASAA